MTRKQGRPKAGSEPLTHEQILITALQLVDQHGVEKLTMRQLAARLNVDPMAIYHYLPNKQAVIMGLVEMVFSELKVSISDDASWQERVLSFANAYRNLIRQHSNLAFYLVTHAEITTTSVLVATEVLYGALKDAGLSPSQIIQAGDLIIDYLNGLVLGESSGYSGDRRDWFNALEQQSGDFPVMYSVFNSPEWINTKQDEGIRLEIILAGIEVITKR